MSTRTSMARSIGSLVWTAVTGGTKILVKFLWVLRRSRGKVKEGARYFYQELLDSGIPREDAILITEAYMKPTLEMLKVRNMIKLIGEIAD